MPEWATFMQSAPVALCLLYSVWETESTVSAQNILCIGRQKYGPEIYRTDWFTPFSFFVPQHKQVIVCEKGRDTITLDVKSYKVVF